MDNMRLYEFDPQELDEVLAFRNKTFNYVSSDHWAAMNCTAVVARQDEKLMGFVPLQFREQCINARVSIPVVYENAVGVAEEMRGRGIGSQLLEKAAQFIGDRADAMMVIRGGEQTPGYRFYRKTGHSDVLYAYWYTLPAEIVWSESAMAGFSILERADWRAIEPELLALYERQCGAFGGGQKRRPGYWDMILDGHVYRQRQWNLVTLTAEEGRMAGYMAAVRGLSDDTDQIYIYEVVGENEEAVERLIRYARTLSANGELVAPYVSVANPVCCVLERLGFTAPGSASQVMARLLRPDRIFQRLAAGSGLCQTLSFIVRTPHRMAAVNEPPAPRHTVLLQTKENSLSRLFLCRLNLEAALEMELVRWNVRDPGLERELSQVFAFSGWMQWYTDYI